MSHTDEITIQTLKSYRYRFTRYILYAYDRIKLGVFKIINLRSIIILYYKDKIL